jgi:hypothetical protein
MLVLSVALAACGSKAKKTATTPDRSEMKSGAMGGAGYGGSAAPMSGADPCAAK